MTGDAPTASAGDRWRLVPILGWIRSYDRGWLRGDLIAGVAVAALIVPKNLGYAGIAGIPLQNGLYAAAAGAILYAIFGTSRQISTGPSSGLAARPRSTARPAELDVHMVIDNASTHKTPAIQRWLLAILASMCTSPRSRRHG
jgi:MFS superfamily sulfate permease-like transporter